MKLLDAIDRFNAEEVKRLSLQAELAMSTDEVTAIGKSIFESVRHVQKAGASVIEFTCDGKAFRVSNKGKLERIDGNLPVLPEDLEIDP